MKKYTSVKESTNCPYYNEVVFPFFMQNFFLKILSSLEMDPLVSSIAVVFEFQNSNYENVCHNTSQKQ